MRWLGWLLLVTTCPIAWFGCAWRQRMCLTEGECGASYGCVAGRCVQTTRPGVDAAAPVAAISDRGIVRLSARPSAIGYLRRGDGVGAGVPEVAVIGRSDDARLLLRFEAAIPEGAVVVEAFLLLTVASEVDPDPERIALHAARVAEPWTSASISWTRAPRIEETQSPATLVAPTGRRVVRLDVRALVARWALHDARDQGLAVLADGVTLTGVAIRAAGPSPELDVYYRLPDQAVDAGLPVYPPAAQLAVDAGATGKK